MSAGVCTFTQANENDFSHEPRTVTVFGKLTFTDNYATGGLVCDLSSLKWARTKYLPINVTISPSNGHTLVWVAGTTLANGKVAIFTTAATEATNAAGIPAGIAADTDIFCAITFRKV